MRPNISDIIAAVGAHYGVARIDILSDRREEKLVKARHVCCWLAKELTLSSYPQIGTAMHRDHTSVMNGVAQIEKHKKTDDLLLADLHELMGRLERRTPTLQELVERTEHVAPNILKSELQAAVLHTGGTWCPPRPRYGDHLFVIQLYELTAYGRDEEDCCRNWRRIAETQLSAQAA